MVTKTRCPCCDEEAYSVVMGGREAWADLESKTVKVYKGNKVVREITTYLFATHNCKPPIQTVKELNDHNTN